ncbi:MAG: metal-sensitive transcriptional regulator [Cyanobacteria bacterium REEB67]|nr:metal-sensitive transcriptional regulator [Cyanobacteria bacterium REEB67]
MAITGEAKRALTLRLAKAIGHLVAVQRMVEEEKYCMDVLNQLKAVQSALDRTAQVMLKQHLDTCVVEAVKANDSARVMDELWQLLRKGTEGGEGFDGIDATDAQDLDAGLGDAAAPGDLGTAGTQTIAVEKRCCPPTN